MTEYVYALHDFSPEHEDEISFKAGERIEVVEKDDLYGDGWWQGRNLAGKVGLFPQGYTSASAPLPDVRTPTTLQPLQEEGAEDVSGSVESKTNATSHTVMAATLTDVQEAIEQLAVRRDQDADAGRSFSFASSRDPETETEDEGGEENEGKGQGWHKDARKALAERAEKENAKKLREEEAEANRYTPPRSGSQAAPPIPVELSDESDADDEDEEAIRNRHDDIHPHHHKYSASTSTAVPPEVSLNDSPVVSMPEPEPLQPAITLSNRQISRVSQSSQSSLPTPTSPSPPQEVTIVNSPSLAQPKPQTPTTATVNRFPQSIAPPSYAADIASSLPSPATSSGGGAGLAVNVPLPKSPSPPGGAVPQPIIQPETVTPPQPREPDAQVPSVRDSLRRTHPSEWTVEQVVEWLKSKNIDEPTCNKFVEHEITGDVLLELDVNILKEEMNITAFGKRMRIANAIVELRRPASFSSEPTAFHHSSFTQAGTGTGPVADAGSPYTNGHRQEASSTASAEDPYSRSLMNLGLAVPMAGPHKNRPTQLALSSPSEGALNTKALGGQDNLIPEEGEAEVLDERGVQSENDDSPGLSRGQGSTGNVNKRRRFLGLSAESGSSRGDKDKDSSSRKSNEVTSPLSSIPNSPSFKTSPSAVDDSGVGVGRRQHHMKGKRSIDGSKGTERLSFFSTTLGKSRKPPPRYSMYETETSPTSPPERSTRSISRLYLGSGSKKNGRPTTPGGPAKEHKEKDKHSKEDKDTPETGIIKEKDPTVLRKRHLSTTSPISAPVVSSNNTTSGFPSGARVMLQPGQSVLDQIGRPDHAGWLRKKGERYNTWKLRYLVLKGPHLYYLRSNSRSETKIKGYIKVQGYKVIADENANPGKYGFRIVHDHEQSHFFSSEEQVIVREWMKALMKATIDRDFSKPVVSSCNIPTIPLSVAQAMNPAPRPPSPSARAATQKALRRENPNQLSSRDARILMGLPAPENGAPLANGERARIETFFDMDGVRTPNVEEDISPVSVPPRPSRDMRHPSGRDSIDRTDYASEVELVDWANSVLPNHYRIHDLRTDLMSGLVLLRLAEIIKGTPSEPSVPDSAFAGDNNLEGMFKLFDFLLDHDVKMGSVSINDIKQGRRDKTLLLLKALKVWSDKRKAIARSIGKGAGQAGPWMAMEPGTINW